MYSLTGKQCTQSNNHVCLCMADDAVAIHFFTSYLMACIMSKCILVPWNSGSTDDI